MNRGFDGINENRSDAYPNRPLEIGYNYPPSQRTEGASSRNGVSNMYPQSSVNQFDMSAPFYQSSTNSYENSGRFQSEPVMYPKPVEPNNQIEKSVKGKTKPVEVTCTVCNIKLSSQIVYDVHIQGKKHLRKEKEAKMYSCELCMTQMFTMEEQKAHNESEEHLESVKVAEFFQKQKDEDPDYQRKLAAKATFGKYLTSKELEEIRNMSYSGQKWLFCELCNVKCNSEYIMEVHKESKKHKNKETEIKQNKKSASLEFSCKLCNHLCYTSEEKEAHLKSDEHLNTVLEKGIKGGEPVSNNQIFTEVVNEETPDVVPFKDENQVLWYRCDICDVKMNSLDNYKTHVNSKKHARKLGGGLQLNRTKKYSSEALRTSYTRFVAAGELGKKITGDPSAFCARCEIQFDTSRELEEHFLTPSHKNHNPYKKKLCFDQGHGGKKAKVAKTNENPTSTTPLPTNNYGYGYQTHNEFPSNNTNTYANNYQAMYPNNASNSTNTFSNNYSNAYSNGYGNPSVHATNYNANNSYQPNRPAGYSYSTPYYQH